MIMGPNIRYVGGAYWDFFDHHLALTERSVVEAFRLSGFEPEKVVDRFQSPEELVRALSSALQEVGS